jgi:CRISPR/Cas system CSM-associated protein Csm4 (group 5 of RAMP superfamily)
MALTEVRLRPTGPWRAGERTGDRERVDAVYHSDALYSAVTHAMKQLGWLEDWLDATARAGTAPQVRFSSLFPFIGETRLVAPPRTSWPPSGSAKLHVNAAKLVPLEVACHGIVNESRWSVNGACECLLPVASPAPFETGIRTAAAVDRLTGHTEPHRTACLEFAPNAGWWGLIEFASAGDSPAWESRVKSAFRLLADSGFGGERSRGWGRAAEPEFADASALFPEEGHAGAWWMLSLYSPHEEDQVDWSRGDYAAVTRAGWTDSAAGGVRKKNVRMIGEGSVLMAPSLRGRAVDVAPDGFPHPAWRAGFALAVPVPIEVEV